MILTDKSFLKFTAIFLGTFALCYFGTLFFIGLAVPGGSYSPLIEKYFNIASWMRSAIILSSKWLLSLFGTATYRADEYVLRGLSGKGVRIVYSCLGFGVMSFWAAYIIATPARMKKKILWFFIGIFSLFIINVVRISLVLTSSEKGWQFPFGLDHHTWFNIVAYLFIFILIFSYQPKAKLHERSES